MHEQEPLETHDGNPEYIEQHPNAVTDQEKAEFMARASRLDEEDVVSYSNKASETMESLQDTVTTYARDGKVESAKIMARSAVTARERANDTAVLAGRIFDVTKSVRVGRSSKLDEE